MEKKFARGCIVVNKGAEEFKSRIVVLVTGDRSKRDDHFSGVCISTYDRKITPIGDFSDTWHLSKFEKLFDSFEEWLEVTAYATKLLEAEEKIKVLDYDNKRLRGDLEGYKEAHEGHKQLARDMDVLMNGDKAAKQASLVDIFIQLRKEWPQRHPGPRWVKASEYDYSKGGVLFYRFLGPTLKSCGTGNFSGGVFHGLIGDHFSKDQWEYLYILDESAGGSEAVEAIAFADWGNSNVKGFNPISEKWIYGENEDRYTTSELYTIFKQQKEK